jgi:GH15 family glucan-1,4-alpha-glucosidase
MRLPFYSCGLLPAAPVEINGYNNTWIRDCYFVGINADEEDRKRIWRGLTWLLEKHKSKLEWHAKHKPHYMFEHLHVRYSPNGDEIHTGWDHRQWDSIANWLEVCIDENRPDLAAMLVDYLRVVDYTSPGAGAWEDLGGDIDAYSISACIHALHRSKEFLPEKAGQIDEMLDKGMKVLNELLPRATNKRHICLSLLGVIWPFNMAGKHQQTIIDMVCKELLREPFGFIRYKGDSFDGMNFSRGHGREMPWLLGDAWMAKIESSNPFWSNRLKAARQQFGGMLPESFYPETLRPNINYRLLWADVMGR